jgi:IclR family transcriptional regulator, pca regulon regulatory protein
MIIIERDIMGGLAKGLAVIETFAADLPRQSISDVAAASGLDRATARRCLLTLAHQGYAEWDGKFFTLTPRVLRLGTACLASMPMPAIVQPALDCLSDRMGESTSVSILDGVDIVYVARAAQRKVMSISLMPGSRLPAYCTSMGRVMLAALPESDARARLERAPRPARTPYTRTGIAEIMAELSLVRAQGFSVIDQEVEVGLCSIAVPLTNSRGHVIAALNLGRAAGPEPMADIAPRILPNLLDVGSQLRGLLR